MLPTVLLNSSSFLYLSKLCLLLLVTTAGLLGLVAAYFLCDECGGLKLQEIDGVSFIGGMTGRSPDQTLPMTGTSEVTV